MITPFSSDPSDANPDPPDSEDEAVHMTALDKKKKDTNDYSNAKPKKVSDETLDDAEADDVEPDTADDAEHVGEDIG